jgi:hypothetical protein
MTTHSAGVAARSAEVKTHTTSTVQVSIQAFFANGATSETGFMSLDAPALFVNNLAANMHAETGMTPNDILRIQSNVRTLVKTVWMVPCMK